MTRKADELDGEVNQIGHLFADYGVESEALAAYGAVHRFTIDPKPNGSVESTTEMDLMKEIPGLDLDLVILHPNCARFCDMPNVDPSDHENQIPRAREIAEQIATDYVIENKPRSPLDDPVVLNGRMFGLPLAYERAFETSFAVDEPATQQTIGKTVTPYFYSDRTAEWWRGVKGYVGDYPKQHVAKNTIPAAYIHHICRSWLESRDSRDAEKPQDNNSRAPRDLADEQETIVTDGGFAQSGDGGDRRA